MQMHGLDGLLFTYLVLKKFIRFQDLSAQTIGTRYKQGHVKRLDYVNSDTCRYGQHFAVQHREPGRSREGGVQERQTVWEVARTPPIHSAGPARLTVTAATIPFTYSPCHETAGMGS